MRMIHPSKPHIVVVGAGILGASIAFHLTLRGAQVTIVDAAAPGQATTRISFAWINAFSKDPFHYHDLNRRSMEMWERFVRRLDVAEAITWGGELQWMTTEAGAEALRQRVNVVQGWGYPTRLLDRAEVKQLEPDLDAEPMTAAAYSDIEGHIHTQQVIHACMRALSDRGAEICDHTHVTDLQISARGSGGSVVEAVHIGAGAIACDAVVLACGADMPALATMASIELPVTHTFGATILTEPMAPLFATVAVLHPSRDSGPLVNFRQFKDGTVMLQGGSHGHEESGDRGRSDDDAAAIVRDAATYVPALNKAKIKTVQRGRRPIPRDGHPILGFSEEVSNLYVATTHSGVTLAPIIGEMAAMEILERADVALFTPYRPARFGSQRVVAPPKPG